MITLTDLKIDDKHTCEKGCGSFTVNEFFFCPKCLQVVPSGFNHTLNNIRPIILRIMQRILKRREKIQNENPQSLHDLKLCDRFIIFTLQLLYNITLEHEAMTAKSVDEFFQKMNTLTGVGIGSTHKDLENYIHNSQVFTTKSFHGECTFAIDGYLRAIDREYNGANNTKTSVILKEIINKIDPPFDKIQSPISALAEIRNTYHNDAIPDNDECFRIDSYLFKLEKDKPHHFMTLFHVFYLLEKSWSVLEQIMDNKYKL